MSNNWRDISNIISRVEINLYKQNTSDTCTIYTANISALPFREDKFTEFRITDSIGDLLFYGRAIYPIREPLKPNNQNLYTIKLEPYYDIAKKTVIKNGQFYNQDIGDIVRFLVARYIPGVSIAGIQHVNMKIDIDLSGWNVFNALQFLADLCMYIFKIGYGRYGYENQIVAYFTPYNTENYRWGLIIDDEHFADATPFYYDISNVYNKVKVIGKPVKTERGIYEIIRNTITEYTIYEEYDPYDISVELYGKILEGKVVSSGDTIIWEGSEEYAYYKPNKTIYFREPIVGSDIAPKNLVIRYNVDIPITVELQDEQSIAQYGVREAENLIFDWIDNYDTLYAIAEMFLKTHKKPVLHGSVTVERDQIPFMIYPGDKVYLNLSRYYIGFIDVGSVKHVINNNRHWITIETDTENIWDMFARMLRAQKDLEKYKPLPPPQILTKNSDNAIEWKTEFVIVPIHNPDDLETEKMFKEVELKTIFLEVPFIQWSLRIKPDIEIGENNDVDWNQLVGDGLNLITTITYKDPETGQEDTMTIDEFKQLTGTTWNINWGTTHFVVKRIWYTNVGSYVEYPDYFEIVIRITGYGAWKK